MLINIAMVTVTAVRHNKPIPSRSQGSRVVSGWSVVVASGVTSCGAAPHLTLDTGH